jgi:hypothetical protein
MVAYARPRTLGTELRNRNRVAGDLSVAPGPPQELHWRPTTEGEGTSGPPDVWLDVTDWTAAFDATFTMITHDAVRVETVLHVPPATTGEVRLRHVGLNVSTDAVSVVGDASQAVRWDWVPGWDAYLGSYGTTQLRVEARRTSGTDPIGISWPSGVLAPVGEIGATDTGL